MCNGTVRIDLLQHALGLDKFGRGRAYRNHFVTSPGCTDWKDCCALVKGGLLHDHGAREIAGGSHVFSVTDEGRAYVRTHSAHMPKFTRSQLRYLRWLDEDSGVGFGEWLRRH